MTAAEQAALELALQLIASLPLSEETASRTELEQRYDACIRLARKSLAAKLYVLPNGGVR
jgi:hypothetical protein